MALFRTNEELKQYFPARMTLEMQDIAQTMERVEHDYLSQQVLGAQQLQELQAAYDAETATPDTVLGKLLHHARAVVAHLVAYHYADLGALQLTSTGFVVNTGGSGSEGVAATSRIDRLKRELLTAGFSFMDRMLGFLQYHKVDFPLWAESTYADRAKGLMRSTTQLTQSVEIGNSHWFYWKIWPLIERNQDESSLVAKTLCSPTLYATLVEESEAGDAFSTAAHRQLIKIIRSAIAHASIAEAITDGSIIRDDRGIWTFQSFSGGGSAGGPVGATDKRLDTWKDYHQGKASEFIEALQQKCQALAAAGQLPDYVASPCYQSPSTPAEPERRDPTSRVGSFM